MIISHKKKFIFIKPQKTAGTSVELFLTKFCGDQDIITPFIYEPDKNIRKKTGARESQNYSTFKSISEYKLKDIYKTIRFVSLPKIVFTEHLNAIQIKNMVSENIWKEYKKISIVRNPWDHAVSYYKWYLFRGHFKGSFTEFVKLGYNLQEDFLFMNDVFICDKVIKFESLNKDLIALMKDLQLQGKISLPEAKKQIRKKDDNYRDYYDEKTENIVRLLNKKIIKKFEYEF